MIVTRAEVVAEAREWKGTPYHLQGMVKKAGVDCGLLPYAVYRKFDLVPEFTPESLSHDWFCNTTQEKYLLMVQRYLRKLVEGRATLRVNGMTPPPASLVLSRVVGSRVFNHSGIVTAWPMVIHASHRGVVEADASQEPGWAHKEIVVFDPFPADPAAEVSA